MELGNESSYEGENANRSDVSRVSSPLIALPRYASSAQPEEPRDLSNTFEHENGRGKLNAHVSCVQLRVYLPRCQRCQTAAGT